jgi:hypothetical protein
MAISLFMERFKLFPPIIFIHSANKDGAEKIRQLLLRNQCNPTN